jgi:hypothetical protein
LYSLSVGGADASQNGFGLLMPKKFDVKSAICSASLMHNQHLHFVHNIQFQP